MKARASGLLRLGVLPFLLATALGSCTPARPEGSAILRRLEGEPKTLNALLATGDPDLTVISLLSRNLLDYDASLNMVPGLAESVEPDREHLRYTVKLRPGAVWEDGTPVTAEDVAFTITALVDPATPSLNRRGFFEGYVRTEKLDDRTAVVVFSSATSTRLDAFSLPLLPAVRYRGTSITTNPLNRTPLANGPYRLARWKAGSSLELERNPRYFGEPGGADRILFRIVPESAAAFQGLRTGALDESRLTHAQVHELGREKTPENMNVRTLVWRELGFTYVGWNNRLPIFSSPSVRRALTALIDREGISRALYGGLATPAAGPLPPGLWPYDPTLRPIAFDPAGAAAALDAAGFVRGKDGVRRKGDTRFAFTLLLGAASDTQRQISESVQQAYREAGIEMTIRPMEWAAFSAAVDAGDFEACLLAMHLDPNPDLSPFWHSSQVPPVGWNSSYYRNPRADALMDELRRTFDRARARPLYVELQRIIAEDQPWTFLHNVPVRWGVNRRIDGVDSSPIGLFLFWPGSSAWRPIRVKGPA